MQKNAFQFLGRRIELWTHPEPDHLATIIRSTGRFYEPDVLMKILEIYLPGTAIIDVGANIGNHTVFFAAILGAPVLAVEPYAPNHELLQLNIAANGLEGLVRTHCAALGERDASGYALMADAGNFGTVRIQPGDGEIPIRSGACADGIIPERPTGLIKIDVEGGEAAGAGRCATDHPALAARHRRGGGWHGPVPGHCRAAARTRLRPARPVCLDAHLSVLRDRPGCADAAPAG